MIEARKMTYQILKYANLTDAEKALGIVKWYYRSGEGDQKYIKETRLNRTELSIPTKDGLDFLLEKHILKRKPKVVKEKTRVN